MAGPLFFPLLHSAMTNSRTLPEGICILKAELINSNESLIGRICCGDIFIFHLFLKVLVL